MHKVGFPSTTLPTRKTENLPSYSLEGKTEVWCWGWWDMSPWVFTILCELLSWERRWGGESGKDLCQRVCDTKQAESWSTELNWERAELCFLAIQLRKKHHSSLLFLHNQLKIRTKCCVCLVFFFPFQVNKIYLTFSFCCLQAGMCV